MTKQERNAAAGLVAAIVVGALVAWAGSDGSVELGGWPVFAIGALLAYVINWLVFVPSYLARTEHYFDLTGSATYISVVVVALLASDGLDLRALLSAGAVLIWALRLGSFLFARVRRAGGDSRFDVLKTNVVQFLSVWTVQGLWVLLTLAAVLAVITTRDRQALGVVGVVGFAVWVIGFAIEVIADRQKSAFRADQANAGRFITTGLWSWSRHPNYFGEIVLWAGLALVAVPVLDGWRWVVLISPLFVFFLLTRVSGVPLLERSADKRWGGEPEYEAYKAATSVLVPLPPRRG